MNDWLFQIPARGQGVEKQQEIIAQRLQADPAAAAISDEEAEAFFAAALGVAFADPETLQALGRLLGLRVRHSTPKQRRRGVLAILRMWQVPRAREHLEKMVRYIDLGGLDLSRHTYTLDELVQAYWQRNTNVVWLVRILRLTDRAGEIESFLDRLDHWARTEYRFFLDIGRLMLRRVVYGDPAASDRAARLREEYRRLTERLANREAHLAALQKKAAAAGQSRRGLRRQVRRAGTEIEALLARAREELAAAERELAARREAHRQEAARLAAEHEGRMARLRRELDQELAELKEALSLGQGAGMAPLAGLRVAVVGDEANQRLYGLLVESAGGRPARGPEEADLTVVLGAPAGDSGPMRHPAPAAYSTPEAGPAAFERLLRREILPALWGRVRG